ncbi:MAG: U32 family peptidase [Phycisphaerae bacterium]|nr:U32 family peptidase [Phycisphaerae bacterium]
MQKIELLAPAQNSQSGITAIRCGADAVYIGAQKFGARQAASNSISEIQEVIEFAHQFYAKVYVVLNTLLYDSELAQAQNLIASLSQCDIDGLIVQDMALLEMDLPPVPLIASTQMHNCTVDKVKFLEDVGFSRVILARELSLDQIAEIRKHTSVELECFIHGALCVGYSGQCYMSYAQGGRSGNRGQCAQPCRKPYSLYQEDGTAIVQDRFLLSIKDMNLSEHLADLLDIGVNSFKIEGRLKNDAYVANVVGYYRELLDELLPERNMTHASSGNVQLGFEPDPAKTFNRSFTNYNIDSKKHKLGSIDTPKAMGEFVGVVSEIGQQYFMLDRDNDLSNADGLCFFDSSKKLQGTVVNSVEGGKIFPQKMDYLTKGVEIFRNYNHKFISKLEGTPADRRINLKLRVYDTADGIALEAVDCDSNIAIVELKTQKEPARNGRSAQRNIVSQLTKMGNSIFTCSDIKNELQGDYFFAVSVLNQLRRDLVEQMLIVRQDNRPITQVEIKPNNIPYPQKILDYHGNVLNAKARDFYIRHGVQEISPAAEAGMDFDDKIVMTTKYCIRHQLGLCSVKGQNEPLILIDYECNKFKLEFNCKTCGMVIRKI